MCVVSAVGPAFQPVIPQPTPDWTLPKIAWHPLPNGRVLTEADLQAIIDAFRTAMAAAEKADRLAGQPDCEDPEKTKLRERVAELERRLKAIGDAAAQT